MVTHLMSIWVSVSKKKHRQKDASLYPIGNDMVTQWHSMRSEMHAFLTNKAKTYKVFESFFKRKAVDCNSPTPYEMFVSFTEDLIKRGYTLFVTKHLESSFGIVFAVHSVSVAKTQFAEMNREYNN